MPSCEKNQVSFQYAKRACCGRMVEQIGSKNNSSENYPSQSLDFWLLRRANWRLATLIVSLVAPVDGMQEYRFAVFDVSKARQQDAKYFKAIFDEMEDGGYEALLHHLQNYDIEGINLRQPAKTEALLDQILASMPVEQSWWLEVLQQGKIKSHDKEWEALSRNFGTLQPLNSPLLPEGRRLKS